MFFFFFSFGSCWCYINHKSHLNQLVDINKHHSVHFWCLATGLPHNILVYWWHYQGWTWLFCSVLKLNIVKHLSWLHRTTGGNVTTWTWFRQKMMTQQSLLSVSGTRTTVSADKSDFNVILSAVKGTDREYQSHKVPSWAAFNLKSHKHKHLGEILMNVCGICCKIINKLLKFFGAFGGLQ